MALSFLQYISAMWEKGEHPESPCPAVMIDQQAREFCRIFVNLVQKRGMSGLLAILAWGHSEAASKCLRKMALILKAHF